MVKDIKYIIKKILIGVGIVLVLSFLRGNLLISASALEPTNVSPNGMCWYSNGVAPDGCYLTPTQFQISWTYFYGNQFGADGTVERFFWRYYKPNIGGKYYNIDLLFYNGADSLFIDSNRGYIQNSANNIFSCHIDNTRWGHVGTSSSATTEGTATVHCDNVYLTDDYFTFHYVDGTKQYNSIYAVTDATLTPTSQQSVIDNQNENTQQQIQNQNENTEKEIESQKVCSNLILSVGVDNKFLNNNGSYSPDNVYWFVSDYVSIVNKDIIPTQIYNGSSGANICTYDKNKTLISCFPLQDLSVGTKITFPSNAFYFRTSVVKASLIPKFQICQNGNQAIADSNQELNNTLNNSSTDDPNNDINSMNSKTASNNSITQLLTLPITLFQNVLNNINGSCSAYSLGSLYGTTLTLPCINLENILGSTLWGVIDVLISGLFILSFRKKMVDIFNHMSSLNDRGNELE